MTTILTPVASQWHPGEQAMHRLLRVPEHDNPTSHGLPPSHGYRIASSPLLAFGTLDRRGRPWATVWGGEAGLCRPIARGTLGVRATVGVDGGSDAVVQNLFAVPGGEEEEEEEGCGAIVDDDVVRHDDGGKVVAALAIDLETRDRVKLAGRMLAGSVTRTDAGVGEMQMAVRVDEALGNCPKYLNKRRVVPRVPTPRLVSRGVGAPLPREAVELIGKADLFFIASRHGGDTGDGEGTSMDVNHRGGPPGFLRVLRNGDAAEGGEGGGVTLVYPEYSGNRLYQTLGNLREDPYAGVAVPDFATGDVLYLTGRATILIGDEAAAYMPRTRLAVKIEVEEARFVADGLAFRGEVVDYSPYNPPVRRLLSEKDPVGVNADNGGSAAIATATLADRHVITPTISRYVFRLASNPLTTTTTTTDKDGGKLLLRPSLRAWHPGQHITLDFGAELDHGWSHMRDDDPQSLNDDFVRTFTVSAPLDRGAIEGDGRVRQGAEPEVEVVVRRHGPVTGLLARWNIRAPLEVPVLGFGGLEGFSMPAGEDSRLAVFVAGGVGITPLMAQAAAVLEGGGERGLRVLWSLRGEDLPLAVDVFDRIEGLSKVTRLFVTGQADGEGRELMSTIREVGAVVARGRMASGDVLAAGEKGERKFYCCTGPEMMKSLLEWTEGEEVVFESFGY